MVMAENESIPCMLVFIESTLVITLYVALKMELVSPWVVTFVGKRGNVGNHVLCIRLIETWDFVVEG